MPRPSPIRSTPTTRATACPGRPAPLLQRERLDRRPVPARAVAADLQRGASRRRLRRAAVRRPRPQPRLEQGQHRPGLQRPGRRVLRRKLRGTGHRAGVRERDRLHPDVPGQRPGGGPYTAASWTALHPHAQSFGSAAAQTVDSAGGNPDHRRRLRSDRRYDRRVQDGHGGDRSRDRGLHDDQPRLHAAGPADDHRDDQHARPVRRAHRAAVGRPPRRDRSG